MSFSLSADEYALFVSHYTRKPEEHNDIHFIFSLNQSRFMHLIFNIIQKDICEHICHFLVANNMVLVRGWLVAHSNDEEKKYDTPKYCQCSWDLFELHGWKKGNCSIRFKNLYFIFKYLEASSLGLSACAGISVGTCTNCDVISPEINILFFPFYFGHCRNSNEKPIFFRTTSPPPPRQKKVKFQETFWDSSGQTVYLSDIQVHTCTITFSPFLWKWQTFRCNFLCAKLKKMFIKLLKYRVCHCIYSGRWWHRSHFFSPQNLHTYLVYVTFGVEHFMLPRIFKNDIKH